MPSCMREAFGGPCGRREGHKGHHATIAAIHLDEKDDLRAEIDKISQAGWALNDAIITELRRTEDDPDPEVLWQAVQEWQEGRER